MHTRLTCIEWWSMALKDFRRKFGITGFIITIFDPGGLFAVLDFGIHHQCKTKRQSMYHHLSQQETDSLMI